MLYISLKLDALKTPMLNIAEYKFSLIRLILPSNYENQKYVIMIFSLIKVPKGGALAVSGENQLLCWRDMHIRQLIRIRWMQIARFSICCQHLRRYGGLWLIERVVATIPFTNISPTRRVMYVTGYKASL